jgi:exportin-T
MQAFSQGQHEFLASLLTVVIMKLKYDEDTEWGDDEEEPEEEAMFMEIRKVSLYIELQSQERKRNMYIQH